MYPHHHFFHGLLGPPFPSLLSTQILARSRVIMVVVGKILVLFVFIFLGAILRLLHTRLGVNLGRIFQGGLLWPYLLLHWLLILGKPFHRPIFDFTLNVSIPEEEECWQCLLIGVPMRVQDDVMRRRLELNE